MTNNELGLEKEQEERKTSELFAATLKRQLASVREKCAAFDAEIDQYRATKATLLRGRKFGLITEFNRL